QVKKCLDRAFFRQGFAKTPDGRVIWNPIRTMQSKKTPKAGPVVDLELSLFVTQIVKTLEQENLEHEHDINSFAPRGAFACGNLESFFERRTENLEVYKACQFLQRISKSIKPLLPGMIIEKIGLPCQFHIISSSLDFYIKSIGNQHGVNFSNRP